MFPEFSNPDISNFLNQIFVKLRSCTAVGNGFKMGSLNQKSVGQIFRKKLSKFDHSNPNILKKGCGRRVIFVLKFSIFL
jgi:hypothetical protein